MLGLFPLAAPAGTLSLGTPVVQNNQYTFPVNLQGSGEGVAALDFRLAYDPAVFSPVSAQTGTSAATAQKQVSSNVAAPGEFIVVMMGFNQNVVAPGTVVEVVLEKIGEPANGQSELVIAEPTMATHEGVEIDSSGQARMVRFGDEKTGDETEETPPSTDGTDTVKETPTDPAENSPKPETGRAGTFRVIVAEETENKSIKSATTGGAGSVAPGSPPTISSDSPEGPGGNAAVAGLPPGNTPGAPAPDQPSPATLGEVQATAVSSAASRAPTDAMVAANDVSEKPAALPENEKSGNRGLLFATLFLVAIALPVSAVLLLKMLR